MTQKRFKCQRKYQGMVDGRKDYANCIVDESGNIILTLGFREDCIDVCELLNELNDEIYLLDKLKMDMADELGRCIDENERLKSLIKKTLETTPIEHNLAVELKNSVRELYD